MIASWPAHAETPQVRRGPVPDWVVPSEPMAVPEGATGPVFVRRNDSLIHLNAQGQSYYLGYRIKILHSNALQLGNLSIAWNPSAGAPFVHAIRVHRGTETVDVLANTSFEILRREGQLEAASLDGILTAILRVPDLRVGDEIEVAMTLPLTDPTLAPNDSGFLFLSPDTAPGRFRLALSWDQGHKPNFRITPDLATVAVQRNGRSVTVDFDNPPPLLPPQDAPARFAWQRLVEYSDFPDWLSISRHFAPLFARAATLAPESPIKAEARRIAAAHSTPMERARAALQLVQQDVRYVYVGLNGGNLTPATADETWQRRWGDCKGKTALLMALLSELQIEARPVLVNNNGADDGLDERLPSPRLFDHVLVQARIGDRDYWLDGTLPPVAVPSLDPAIPYRWTLPVTAQGAPLARREWRAAETPDVITLWEFDARAGFDRPSRITRTTIVRGIAGIVQQAELSAISQAQLLSSARQQIGGSFWETIDAAEWRYDARAQATVVTMSGTGSAEWNVRPDGIKTMTLPGGGFSPPARRVRPSGQNQDAPYYNAPEFSCDVTTVRLPEGTNALHWSFNSAFDMRIFGVNYYRAFELRDGSIRMVRGLRVEQREVDPASARRDNARISSFDNSTAVITYDPDGEERTATSRTRVPATGEIDWTADQVPCLGSMSAR